MKPTPSLQLLHRLQKCFKTNQKKHSLPDYSGVLLGIGRDDLEKQFHRSIDSQHGSRGH